MLFRSSLVAFEDLSASFLTSSATTAKRRPASPQLRSETAILCGMARATLPGSATPWELYAEEPDVIAARVGGRLKDLAYELEDGNVVIRRASGRQNTYELRESGTYKPPPFSRMCRAANCVPYIVPVILVLLVTLTFLLQQTRFGRHIYAVGGNAEAARRAGISVTRIKISVFTLASMLLSSSA